MIDVALSDLGPRVISCREDLECFCRAWAAPVTDVTLAVLGGGESAAARDAGIALSMAIHLMDVLSDITEDAREGNVYLPQDELMRFSVNPHRLSEAKPEHMAALVRHNLDYIRALLQRSLPLARQLSLPGGVCALGIAKVYEALLNRLQDEPHRVCRAGAVLQLSPGLVLGALCRAIATVVSERRR